MCLCFNGVIMDLRGRARKVWAILVHIMRAKLCHPSTNKPAACKTTLNNSSFPFCRIFDNREETIAERRE